jgi:hypothetical protein
MTTVSPNLNQLWPKVNPAVRIYQIISYKIVNYPVRYTIFVKRVSKVCIVRVYAGS